MILSEWGWEIREEESFGMKHYTVQFQPDNLVTTIHAGATLLEAAGQAGVVLATPCGGIGRCGKCAVRLLPTEKEVLACQYIVEHDLAVLVPDSSRFFKQKILEHGIYRKVDRFPSVQKIFFGNPPSQIETLCGLLADKVSVQIVPNRTNETLSSRLRSYQQSGVTAILSRGDCAAQNALPSCYHLTEFEPGDTTKKLYGAAVDIGTTTIVARLTDLNTGQGIATTSAGNPQSQYGADVISRISHCENDSGSEQLHSAVIGCLNDLLQSVARQAGIECGDIYEMTAVGNTTMNHLLLKHPVHQLGQAPYQAYSLDTADRKPKDLGLQINPAGNIHVLANIAGFIGSDTVAAALACGMDITDTKTLLVDIGTNGEIVFGTQSRLLAASCAAGPALEGAGIAFGSRAQSGAIERVFMNGVDLDIDVIDSVQPTTLCGSGLIDAIAVMLELGIIDSTGRFCDRCELDPMLLDSIRRRVITHNNKPAFVLAGNYTKNQWNEAVFLTQKDIRQMQLAKAAIRAGIELLLQKAEANTESIQQLLLAGAFGNYIQKESAVRIGLLPNIPIEKIHFVGNAAGSGAQMALISQDARKMAKKLAEKIDYVEIAHQTEFQMVFSEFLLFPEN
ncbi:MAG: metal-binding protein [Planctomycetota bacterium]|nr:MAG: metal-binding protein [Planctomycetota bacterium]